MSEEKVLFILYDNFLLSDFYLGKQLLLSLFKIDWHLGKNSNPTKWRVDLFRTSPNTRTAVPLPSFLLDRTFFFDIKWELVPRRHSQAGVKPMPGKAIIEPNVFRFAIQIARPIRWMRKDPMLLGKPAGSDTRVVYPSATIHTVRKLEWGQEFLNVRAAS
jgi:hypothetical protein